MAQLFSHRRFARIHRQPFVIFACLVTLAGPGLASDDGEAKPDKLFKSETNLDVTITAPWRELVRNTGYQGGYPGQMTYRGEDGSPVTIELSVERRGLTRQRVCDYPPIRLRFEKEAVKGTAFRGQKSLKMVTHCKKASRYEQYYVLEMLIYRMYNLLTDYSFRVRTLQVAYVDSDSGRTDEERFAFLIEDDSDVAKRNDLKKLDVPKIGPNRLEPEVTGLFSLFQYMIGNVDWAALSGPDPDECCHNVKLIAPEPLQPSDRVYPVPYDFDSAGLIDAEYAAPPDGLPINSVTQRLYRGYCLHNDTVEQARGRLLGEEAALLALVENESRLNSGVRKKAIRYLDRFFDVARDPGKFDKYVIQRCRR